MNADEHRLSPDPSPSIASPRVALDDGLQDPDGLRTEAAERNNVAKTTILHDCSTVGVRERSSLDCGSKAAAFPGWADRVGKAGAALPHSKALDAPRSGTVPRASVMPRVVLLALVLAGSALGSLCVWRQPDADISGIFGSGSYKTVFADITDSMKLRIEKRLGTTLDADETQFKYFPVFKGTKRVGTVMTHAGKGQFGAIEVVVAVVEGDSGPIIKAVRIQRDREKAKAALRGKEFLGQFKGKGLTDAFKVGEDIETAAKGAEKASQAVATAARKLLIVYDELGRP